jgi:hypothetical protein
VRSMLEIGHGGRGEREAPLTDEDLLDPCA